MQYYSKKISMTFSYSGTSAITQNVKTIWKILLDFWSSDTRYLARQNSELKDSGFGLVANVADCCDNSH